MAFFKTRRADGTTSLINLDHIAVMVRTEKACLIQLKCCREVYVTPAEFDEIERRLDVINREQADTLHALREAYKFLTAMSEPRADSNRSKVTLKDGKILQEARDAYANQPPPIQDLPEGVWKTYLVDPSELVKFQVVNEWGTLGTELPPLDPSKVTHNTWWMGKQVPTDAPKAEGTEKDQDKTTVVGRPRWSLKPFPSAFGACDGCDALILTRAWTDGSSTVKLCQKCEAERFGKADGP